MADERRYGEDEVAAIFEEASAPAISRGDARSAEGLTLTELQAIGREVGITPERIADAAASLVRSQPPLPRRTELGMPVSAAHVVELPRALSHANSQREAVDLLRRHRRNTHRLVR